MRPSLELVDAACSPDAGGGGSAGEPPLPTVLVLPGASPALDAAELLAGPGAGSSARTRYEACCLDDAVDTRLLPPPLAEGSAGVPQPWSASAARWLATARGAGLPLLRRLQLHRAAYAALAAAAVEGWRARRLATIASDHDAALDIARALTCTEVPPAYRSSGGSGGDAAPALRSSSATSASPSDAKDAATAAASSFASAPPSPSASSPLPSRPAPRLPPLAILSVPEAVENLAAASLSNVAAAPGLPSAGPLLGKGPRSAAAGMAAWDEPGAGGGRAGRLGRARRDAGLIVGAYLHGFSSGGGGAGTQPDPWEAIHSDAELPFVLLARQGGAPPAGEPTAAAEEAAKGEDVPMMPAAADAAPAADAAAALAALWPRPLALQRRLGGLLWSLAPVSALRRAAAASREVAERERANQRELERTAASTCRANERAARAAVKRAQQAAEKAQAARVAQLAGATRQQWSVEQVGGGK